MSQGMIDLLQTFFICVIGFALIMHVFVGH